MKEKTSRRQLLRYTAAAAGAAGVIGTAGAIEADGESETAGPVTDAPYTVVAVEKVAWSPEILVVPKGATVTFVSNRYPHTVTSTDTLVDAVNCNYNGENVSEFDDTPFTVDSPDETFNIFLGSAETGAVTFDAAGEFPYYCVPHCSQRMVGTVIVR